jgi:hypothetical protein
MLAALLKHLQAPSLKLRPFLGEYTSGNTLEIGPFLGIAPEGVLPPYVVYDVIPGDLDQGFGGTGVSYGERPTLRLHVYDDSLEQAAENMESLIAVMDTLADGDLDLRADEECRCALRTVPPTILAEPVGKKGGRIYHLMIPYEMQNARIKGEV